MELIPGNRDERLLAPRRKYASDAEVRYTNNERAEERLHRREKLLRQREKALEAALLANGLRKATEGLAASPHSVTTPHTASAHPATTPRSETPRTKRPPHGKASSSPASSAKEPRSPVETRSVASPILFPDAASDSDE
jgi:hypothetical protein